MSTDVEVLELVVEADQEMEARRMESNTEDLISWEALVEFLCLLDIVPNSNRTIYATCHDQWFTDTNVHGNNLALMCWLSDHLEFWFFDVILVFFELDFVNQVVIGQAD